MMFEKYNLIMAKFSPKKPLGLSIEARQHIGKTFKWMVVDNIEVKGISGRTYVTVFTPHSKGYEHIGNTFEYDLTDFKVII